MHSGNITALEDAGSRSEECFQKLLLQISEAAAQGTDPASLLRLFCHATREFFRVSGAYFWQVLGNEELVGAEAEGLMAERFRGTRVRLDAARSAVAVECVRQRKTLYLNRVDAARYPMAAEYHTQSILGAPVMVSGDVVGVAVFLHDSNPDFFNEDLAAKATILSGQIGSLLEATRLTVASREQHRRSEILAEVAHGLHPAPDPTAVIDALAAHIRVLLRSPAVAVLIREEGDFQVRVVSGETPQLSCAVSAVLRGDALPFATELAEKAVSSGEPQVVNLDPPVQQLQGLVHSGMLLATPFRTSRTHGAILVFPRQDGLLTMEERSLVSTITSFSAVAIANAELYGIASGQAQELHKLLEISAELNSVANLDQFMSKFVERAASFLGFHRSFLALVENGRFHAQWGSVDGQSQPLNEVFPSGVASRALLNKQPFWTNDASQVSGANLQAVTQFEIKQLLAVPLLGSDGQVLGMFGVLDREDGAGIAEEDVRRARAWAAEAAIALEMTRNLQLAEQHRRRAEALMSLAMDTSALLRVPDFARGLVSRAANILDARSAALAVRQPDSKLEVLVLQGAASEDRSLSRRLNLALQKLVLDKPQSAVQGTAAELIGSSVASALGWDNLIVAPLHGRQGELVAALCLANRDRELAPSDEQLLQAIVGQASVALENARLFTRMDQANRHWVEIFDAISDFIVVHDQQHRVLRVNRPLADFIGVQPSELIGITMSALLAMATDTTPRACHFCRNREVGADEFVQLVLERTYLVSTSRIHGSESESLQTIHVLKDITDRREAERRYRELFDNIQEGLFFTTPEGRFIEVNEALVRMLGYDSREDLLQAEIPAQIYYSEERRCELTHLMEQHGSLRNYHETLRRKDGALIHVLMNA